MNSQPGMTTTTTIRRRDILTAAIVFCCCGIACYQTLSSMVLALVKTTPLSNQVHAYLSANPYNTIITKKNDGGRVVEFGIDIGLRNEMVCSIRDRIIHNLGATKRLLELGEDYKDICAGIITYAIEEYGKILFLNNLSPFPPPNNNRVRVPYTSDNNGSLDHYHKFDLAL